MCIRDSNIDCFLSQYIFKNPGAWGQPWHQDSSYFPFDRYPQVGAWVATSPATIENGCLVILPGSHKEHLHEHVPDDREGSNYGYTEIKDQDITNENPVTIETGDLLLIHTFLIHKYYDNKTKSYIKIPGQEGFIILKNTTDDKVIWSNNEARLIDIGDGILNLEFGSKMNSINQNIIQALDKSVDLAEANFKGLVLGNESPHFSAGADISVIFLAAVEQEYDELNYFMKMFQNTMMKLRYSSIPVIGAPHGYTLGGGCEVCLHCDKLIAYSETYIGLVEVGVGLIPGGGGLKEMALRASDKFRPNDVEVNLLQEYFINVGMAKTATSAYEGFDLDYLVKGRDHVIMNKKNQISIAKNVAINIYDCLLYTSPSPRDATLSRMPSSA